MLTPAHMELHMGVLQNRLALIKGQMNVAMAKMNFTPEQCKANEVDPEKERLRWLSLDKQHQGISEELRLYEDKVLSATNF